MLNLGESNPLRASQVAVQSKISFAFRRRTACGGGYTYRPSGGNDHLSALTNCAYLSLEPPRQALDDFMVCGPGLPGGIRPPAYQTGVHFRIDGVDYIHDGDIALGRRRLQPFQLALEHPSRSAHHLGGPRKVVASFQDAVQAQEVDADGLNGLGRRTPWVLDGVAVHAQAVNGTRQRETPYSRARTSP